MEGNSCDEATKHDVPCKPMIEAVKMVVKKETSATALPGDHTPQEKELVSVYHAKAITTAHDGVGD